MKSFIFIGVCSMLISRAFAINLPYEVESTLLDLLKEKDLDDLDTSNRSIVPIYRKDLDPNYIAYYEIFVHGKQFFVLSAGPKTGDHRVAESGPGPLPTKLLIDQAKKVKQVCAKFYLLTSMGLFMCENQQGTAVAASHNWMNDAPISDWTKIQKMVEDSLENFKKEWEKIASNAKEEWKTSQRKPANEKPALSNYNAEIVSLGSTAKVALEKGHGKITIHAIPSTRQYQLCGVLVEVCNGDENQVNKELIHKVKSGLNYLEFQVKDGKDVRSILKNRDLSFYFKIQTKDGEQISQYFSLDLSHLRRRRSWKKDSWEVKSEDLFPDYYQHDCCGCVSGCGPVAWASILAYYDRVAELTSYSGYTKDFWSCSDGNNCVAPKEMDSDVKTYIESIHETLGTFCLFGGGATTPKDMRNIMKFIESRGITSASLHRFDHPHSWSGWKKSWIRERAALQIRDGFPVIVGIWKGNSMHYAIATKYSGYSKRYRKCFFFFCWNKTEYHDTKFYLHMGYSDKNENGWYNINSMFAAFTVRP